MKATSVWLGCPMFDRILRAASGVYFAFVPKDDFVKRSLLAFVAVFLLACVLGVGLWSLLDF